MTEERERTPREELVVSMIQVVAMVGVAVVIPIIERLMSDPDIGYRAKWHVKHFQRKMELRLHELGMATETIIGLWQLEEFLRNQWSKERHDKSTGVGRSDPEGAGS